MSHNNPISVQVPCPTIRPVEQRRRAGLQAAAMSNHVRQAYSDLHVASLPYYCPNLRAFIIDNASNIGWSGADMAGLR